MDVKGKTKDTINTWLDLKEMNIRPELHPIQRGEKVDVPTACYTLSPEDKHKLCLFLKNLKLTIHLAGEAEIASPIHYRWMYPIERWLYFLKSVIGNRACPEGCVAEGYITIECMTLCSRFNMKTENEDGSIMKSTIRYSFVVPGAIGRGRGRGLKSLTSKVKIPAKSLLFQSSDLVKQYIQEVETGTQHNTSNGDDEMDRKTPPCLLVKNTIVLEKENTQTKSPCSTDQVMQASQRTKTVGTNSNLFSRHLGKIIRDKNMCPLGVSSWSDIKQQRFDHMWAAVEDKFESVDFNDHRDHIFGLMNELWNKWRGYLHATYVKNKPIVQALKNIPKAVEKKEWEWLVKEHFCSECFQARSKRNAENRAKLNMFPHIGSKPIREIIYQQAGKDGNPPNLATAFFETCKKDNLLAQIEEILKVEPYMPSIEIVQKCCGPRNRSHVFVFGGGVKAKDMRGGTSSKAELLSELRSTQEKYKSLNEKNKSLNDHLSTIEDDLKEIRNMKELFTAQQSHDLHMTSPVSFE
ncbi:hypothetical protein KY284_010517 [Solanum tuberosum]|nr:hypothetical protein KY284_010517 [Solanum tuberosum]